MTQIDRFKGIIIGGLSADVSSDVRVFDLLEHKWHKIDVQASRYDEYVAPRFAHSIVKYMDKLVVYGGGANYLEKSKCRVTLSDLRFFNLKEMKWE